MTTPNTFPTVDDIKVIETKGPWRAKSGGNLNVQFAFGRTAVDEFLNYDNPEFDAVIERSGTDIRGLRDYIVSDIPEGSIGGMEWHRARTEYVSAISGVVLWQCVDFKGQEREYVLNGANAVMIPPMILHTYRALEHDASLQVVCNTLFVPEDPRTHDTFPRDAFYEERAQSYIS